MKQHTRDVVLIPIFITVICGFLFMLWGAWYTGVKWHSPFSGKWLHFVFGAPVPLWFVLIIVGMASFVSWKGYIFYRQFEEFTKANIYLKGKLEEATYDITLSHYWKNRSLTLQERLDKLSDTLPKVHVSWSVHGGVWSVIKISGDLYMSLGCDATFSSSDTTEVIALTRAYLPGTTAWANIMLTKIPSEGLVHEHFHVCLKPVLAKPGEDLMAQVIFVDVKGNEYLSPEHTFQYVPPGLPPHPQAPSEEELAKLISGQ